MGDERLIETGLLRIRSVRSGDEHHICLFGELDFGSMNAVDEEVARVEATNATRIVLDLGGLDFADSSAIGLLVRLYERSRRDAGRLVLLRAPERVDHVFRLTGVDKHLPFIN
jgi:anti-anti-sigma factor